VALASLDGPDASDRWRRLAGSLRRAELRRAVDVVAAVGGGAALVSSDAVPDWLLAGGGAGVLALLAAALFGPDPKAVERLSELLAAWRRE
jgi:hypothetical protein